MKQSSYPYQVLALNLLLSGAVHRYWEVPTLRVSRAIIWG